MSETKTLEALDQFLRDDEPSVFAIKGCWGVGKTYFWKRFMAGDLTKASHAIQRYAYVSLFGLPTIDEIKLTLFQELRPWSRAPGQVEKEPLAIKLDKLLKPRKWGVSALGRFKSTAPIAPLIQTAAFSTIRDALLCFDDLERSNRSLDPNDLLGLFSHLKVEKRCKIVLIYNPDELPNQILEVFPQLREKVIDVEVEFEPTPADAARIAFDTTQLREKELADNTRRLGITNIRLLLRIRRLARLVLAHAPDIEPLVLRQILHTLPLVCWSEYGSDSGAPSLKFLQDHHRSFLNPDDEPKTSPQEKAWQSTLRKYDFLLLDSLDHALCDVVSAGYVDSAMLSKAIEEANGKALKEAEDISFRSAWSLYYGSFADNEEKLCQSLNTVAHNTIQTLSLQNLDAIVLHFRKLGRDEDASKLVGDYFAARQSDPAIQDPRNHYQWGGVDDPEIEERLQAIRSQWKDQRTLKETLGRMNMPRGWDSKDESRLAQASATEFIELFKVLEGDDLVSALENTISFTRISNPNQQQANIAANVTLALKRIASESKLNEVRVKRLGIAPDP